MKGEVKKQERAKRSKQLRIISEKLKRAFYQKHINTKHTALFEKENKEGMLYGFTDNYIKIKVKHEDRICQSKKEVMLNEIDTDGVIKANII